MGRTYDEWIKTVDQGLVAATRKGDEANKPILNQLNWIWCKNMTKSNFSRITRLGYFWPNRRNEKINVPNTSSFCFL